MKITDFIFLLFLCSTLFIYYLLPAKTRWFSLLLFSIVFFSTWGIEYLPLILLLVLLVWLIGIILERQSERDNLHPESKQHNRKKRRIILLLTVGIIIILLAYTKLQYYAFSSSKICMTVSDSVRYIRKILYHIPLFRYFVSRGDGAGAAGLDILFYKALKIENAELFPDNAISGQSVFHGWIVPLGFSYYTLSLIGYLADVYWRKEKAEKNYFKLLLFTIYFPKILEGPISKYRFFSSQLLDDHKFDYGQICFGLQRMIWGYFKKIIIADRLALFVNEVFGNPFEHFGSDFLIAAILGAVQLYCDFSGCMDIGLGISECFGIRLEENFNRPFSSRTVAEFWRRWHITLGIWFKDYVYMPISASPKIIELTKQIRKRFGKRTGKIFSTTIPLLIVWILTGLWHGSGFNYLLWGLYWGALIILSLVFDPEIKKLTKYFKINTNTAFFILFQKTRTFILFVISRFITLPKTLDVTWYAFKQIFTNFAPGRIIDGNLLNLGIDGPRFMVVFLAIAFLGCISHYQGKGIQIRKWVAVKPLPIRWLIYYGIIIAVLLFGAYGPGYTASAFVYMAY